MKKATERRPENRFQNAKDFGAAVVNIIQELSRTGHISQPPHRAREVSKRVVSAGGLVALTALVLIFFDVFGLRSGLQVPVALAEANRSPAPRLKASTPCPSRPTRPPHPAPDPFRRHGREAANCLQLIEMILEFSGILRLQSVVTHL